MLVSTWDENKLHALPSTTFNSFRQQVNIVLTKYNICTLANVIITNPMRIDLFPQSCAIQRFASSNVVQAKERSYRN
jgi:hypothetical protein